MKMTNLTMVSVMNILDSYSNKRLPQKISFTITKNLLKIRKEYEAYEIELKKIFDEYSNYFILDSNGNQATNNYGVPMVSEDKNEEYTHKINELLNLEIDMDFYQIDLDCFDYDDRNGIYDSLSVNEIATLQSMICKSDE